MGDHIEAVFADSFQYLPANFFGIETALNVNSIIFRLIASSAVNSGGGGTVAGRRRSDECMISVFTGRRLIYQDLRFRVGLRTFSITLGLMVFENESLH